LQSGVGVEPSLIISPCQLRSFWFLSQFSFILNDAGEVLLEQKLATPPKAMKEVFGGMPRSRIALETGTHSPWIIMLRREGENFHAGRSSGIWVSDFV
jgi:hypothetical protein